MSARTKRDRRTTSVMRRRSPTPDDEVCGNEDCRTARPPGDASRARAIGQPAHWHHQSDSRLPVGAWYARQAGLRFLRAELPRILATPPDVLSARMVQVISDLAEAWRRLDHRIDHLSNEITLLARQDTGCERLMSVPGIGSIISSAMVAAIGTGDAFTKGRDFAAWLGLVPKQI